MNDRVKFELLEQAAGQAAADALLRAAAPVKQQRNRGLCNMLAMIGGRDAAIEVLAGRVAVDEKGCHIWQGATDYNGYGRVFTRKRNLSVHRLSYEIANGPIPTTGSPDGIGWMVLHRCDVPACCNPDHLYLGTAKHNARDAADRCRTRQRSEKPPTGTVFFEIDGVIRSLSDWADMYQVTPSTLERRLLCGWPAAHLARAPRTGTWHYGRSREYRRFSGAAAVMEYMASKAGGG